jgi:hypothetical protein
MSKWQQVGTVIAKLAPTIGAAVGGPLAGSAISVIESALNLTPKGNTPAGQDAIGAALGSATQEQLLALHQADNDFAVKMAQLGFQNAESIASLAEADRANARSREVSTKDITPRVLALGVTLGFFSLLLFMAMRSVPDSSKDVLNILLGSLGAGWVSIMSYYFGSSSENAQAKTADQAQTAAQATTTQTETHTTK